MICIYAAAICSEDKNIRRMSAFSLLMLAPMIMSLLSSLFFVFMLMSLVKTNAVFIG